jgi:site-specific DNA-cytosine methylase
MKIATLFSGIGAQEQGAKRVYGDNLKMVFACEWDKFARQSFNAIYNIEDAHFHKDVHDVYGTQYQGEVCPTLTKCSFEQNNFVLEERIRRLTPLECWRLQDFPDEAHNKAKASGISDSQLYKQAGNSMSVNVLEMIFRQIEKAKIVGISGSLFNREVA